MCGFDALSRPRAGEFVTHCCALPLCNAALQIGHAVQHAAYMLALECSQGQTLADVLSEINKETNMKTSMTAKSITLIALLGAALAAPVWAQGAGMGGGPGMWNGGPGSGMGPGPGMGMGMGMGPNGRSGRGMMVGQNATRPWALMSPEERSAFQIRMREVKTYDECKQVQAEHRSAMEARAKEKGVTLTPPRAYACDNMKARGLIK